MGGSERKILSVYGRVLANDNALFGPCIFLVGPEYLCLPTSV